jgi:hypothetical protein
MNPATACRPDRDIPGVGRGRYDLSAVACRRSPQDSRRITEYYRFVEENPAVSRVFFRVGVIFRDDEALRPQLTGPARLTGHVVRQCRIRTPGARKIQAWIRRRDP